MIPNDRAEQHVKCNFRVHYTRPYTLERETVLTAQSDNTEVLSTLENVFGTEVTSNDELYIVIYKQKKGFVTQREQDGGTESGIEKRFSYTEEKKRVLEPGSWGRARQNVRKV